MKKSVLIIGIDGASWDFLKPWIDDGKLPALKSLLESGASGDLKTVIPPLSCSAWTSLFTGTNPGKHGIYEYLTDSGELINSRQIKSEKIWNILSNYNKRCCVINVTMTYPLEEINGYMISGILTPPNEKIYSYPPELMNLLKKHGYKISIKYEDKYAFLPDQKNIAEQKDKILTESYDIFNRRYLTAMDIMNEQWDFFMFVFVENALAQYLFWDKKEIILDFFKKIDLCIDDMIKKFSAKNPNPYVFIVSDHGFSAAPKRSFNFRVWMNNEKILEDKRTALQKIIPKVYRKISKLHLSKLLFFSSKSKNIRESFQRNMAKSSNIYYKYPGIFISREGMKENEYEELRDKIISKLRNFRDPANNGKIFQIVEKRESVYSGEYSKLGPDVVVVPISNYQNVFSYESDKLVEDIKLHHPGRHFSDMHGIFLANGYDVRKGTIKNASIMDIFPTVLHILGVPVPKDVDGKVLTEIFKQNSELSKQKIIYAAENNYINLSEKNRIKIVLKDIKI